jgi:ribosome maturation factor RimP
MVVIRCGGEPSMRSARYALRQPRGLQPGGMESFARQVPPRAAKQEEGSSPMTQRGRAGARPARPGGRRTRDEEPRVPAPPRIDLTAARARVRAVIEPVVAAAGYDLEDVGISRAGRRHVVRVLVDTDGGISLDDVAIVSREISAALDAAEEQGAEVLAGEYQLEVGSPGVDRPLTQPRHWRRNRGRLVAVNGLTGRVVETDDRGVVLDVDGTPRELRWTELGPGRVQIEFKRMDEADFGDEADDDEEDDDEDEGEGGE